MIIQGYSATGTWINVIAELSRLGSGPSPRGLKTKEATGARLVVLNTARRVVDYPSRKLNYRFMLAEFCWMAAGLDTVAPLIRYNSKMARYSDDGEHLAGAYGPAICGQFGYVVNKLREDPDTRQAVISIWKPNPQPSKDIPCTISMQFLIRNGSLIMIVSMRSQDAWLGLPYDMFNFMSIQALVAGAVGIKSVGKMVLNVGSLHLYEQHFEEAKQVKADETLSLRGVVLPEVIPYPVPVEIKDWLVVGPHTPSGISNLEAPWAQILRGLMVGSSEAALNVLYGRKNADAAAS